MKKFSSASTEFKQRIANENDAIKLKNELHLVAKIHGNALKQKEENLEKILILSQRIVELNYDTSSLKT